jgi:hypothetical protein
MSNYLILIIFIFILIFTISSSIILPSVIKTYNIQIKIKPINNNSIINLYNHSIKHLFDKLTLICINKTKYLIETPPHPLVLILFILF